MNGYQIPQNVYDDFEAFKRSCEEYKSGAIDDLKFKTIRVPFGIYEQREAGTYMIRVKLTGGLIAPSQLAALGDLAKRFANGKLHITTRGGAQLHYVKFDDFLSAIEGLHAAQLTGRGGGGNTVRNVTADVLAGVAEDEAFDVAPHAIALTEKMLAAQDSYALPRKFKIAFSGSSADRGSATFSDVGFIAKIKDGKRGFKVFIGGGMGAKSRVGKLYLEFLPENEIFLLSQAIKEVFNERGNRRNKHNARLRFLLEEIGLDEFRKLVDEKTAAIKQRGDYDLEFNEPAAPIALTPNDRNAGAAISDEERLWRDRFAFSQKQSGYFGAKIPLELGELDAAAAIALANALPTDRETIRFGCDQNLYLRNLTQSELTALYPIIKTLSPQTQKSAVIGDAVFCAGAATCQLGITVPRRALSAIERAIAKSGVDLDALKGFAIHMSGCPNSCGRHALADLGFFGKASRKDGVAYPAYNILAGARIAETNYRFAEPIGDISAYRLPLFIADALKLWLEEKSRYASYADWVDDGGKAKLKSIAESYADIPSFDEDKNPYYDFGASAQFTLAGRGAGECSAGMYDLIEADKKALKEALNTTDWKQIRFLAARMLLITRGEEARGEADTLAAFKRLFIDAKLIDAAFAKTLEGEATDEAVKLAEAVIALYGSMDNTLKFAAEAQTTAAAPQKPARFKDYRGVECPMNFVRVKMDLSQMASGDALEILLDDGAPIANVPRSVQNEGHTIEAQTQEGAAWRVRIRKK
ncbi:MAG: sulfurtransferase TusA family protein [Helicobacteraceae bacterium]|jgi:sulfite reductase (ferredoxin)|nr:sulfurtransferase TusA family protein [Helicobacteraceae bacterium]